MIYLVLIPLGILFLPWVVVRFVFATPRTRTVLYSQHAAYLLAASLLWIAAFFVPDIRISDETTTFGQHFVGGIVAALLFYYVRRVYGLRLTMWWQEPVLLYGFVSGLGVLNELFEFALTRSTLITIDGGDVWWDLLANTTGALLAYVVAVSVRKAGRRSNQ